MTGIPPYKYRSGDEWEPAPPPSPARAFTRVEIFRAEPEPAPEPEAPPEHVPLHLLGHLTLPQLERVRIELAQIDRRKSR